MMIGNVSDAYNDYKIYPYALGNDRAEKDSAVSSSEECQTCKNRKYQDGSDEMVSFKSAAHVSPQAAAGRVRAHEGEHVSNAYDKAAQKNGTVVYASGFHSHFRVSGMWKDLCFRRNNEYGHPLSKRG